MPRTKYAPRYDYRERELLPNAEALKQEEISPPAYVRERESYPGISPDEAFKCAGEMVAQGHAESEVDPKLIGFINKFRQPIKRLLDKIAADPHYSTGPDQQMKAWQAIAKIHTASAQEVAWLLFRLKLTPLKDKFPKKSRKHRLIMGLHNHMGRFRNEMPKISAKLKEK